MVRLRDNCYTYSISNEVYSNFHFKKSNLNGSFFGMYGNCGCDYVKHDGYELDLSAVQFSAWRAGIQVLQQGVCYIISIDF